MFFFFLFLLKFEQTLQTICFFFVLLLFVSLPVATLSEKSHRHRTYPLLAMKTEKYRPFSVGSWSVKPPLSIGDGFAFPTNPRSVLVTKRTNLVGDRLTDNPTHHLQVMITFDNCGFTLSTSKNTSKKCGSYIHFIIKTHHINDC